MTDPILQKNFIENKLFNRKIQSSRPVSQEQNYLFQRKQKFETTSQSKEQQMFGVKIKIPQKSSQESQLFQRKERIPSPVSKDRELLQSKVSFNLNQTRVQPPTSKQSQLFDHKKQVSKPVKKDEYTNHKKYREKKETPEYQYKRELKLGDFTINTKDFDSSITVKQDKSKNLMDLAKSQVFDTRSYQSYDISKSMVDNSSKPMKDYSKQNGQMKSVLSQMPQEIRQFIKSGQVDNMKSLISQEFIKPEQVQQVSPKCTQTSFAQTFYNYKEHNENDYRRRNLISQNKR